MADVRTTAQDGAQPKLHGNQAINPISAFHGYMMDKNKNGGDIASSLTSGYATIADALRHGSLEGAFANQFLKDKSRQFLKDDKGEFITDKTTGNRIKGGHDYSMKNIKKMKLAGGVMGSLAMISGVGGAIRGVLTDKNEKLDLPGIPGI